MPREERHARQRPALVEVRKFKGSTVYEWDTEPAEERPSEFADSSQSSNWGMASKSAYVMLETRRSRPKAPRRRNSGALWWALALVAAIGAAGAGLMKFLQR